MKQDKVTFTQSNVVNLFIVYELDICSQDLNSDFSLEDYLFGAVELTQNSHLDKYSYSEYDIEFYSRLIFSFSIFDWDKNVVIFRVENATDN